MTDDVGAIARGLTKGQREAVLASKGNGLWSDGRFDFVGARRAAGELYDTLIAPAEPNGLWATYSLTPLGLAVRAHLLATRTSGEGDRG